jgi:hypothetical protein
MSLGIVFKGPEGIVLAADSRVTLTAGIQIDDQQMLLPATYDNATKLLRVNDQKFVGVVTHGLGVIGEREPRTAHSFVPEFEAQLSKEEASRLSVEDFSSKLGDFFMCRWVGSMPKDYSGPDMTFLVGGYDEGAPYGKVFQINIPRKPKPTETTPAFGITWGGQRELTDRLIQGFDENLPWIIQQHLKLSDEQRDELRNHLKSNSSLRIPYQFLPLQDCVDLSISLIRVTITLQTWLVGVRGVGGKIDVATITRTDGFTPIQQKKIRGEQ